MTSLPIQTAYSRIINYRIFLKILKTIKPIFIFPSFIHKHISFILTSLYSPSPMIRIYNRPKKKLLKNFKI